MRKKRRTRSTSVEAQFVLNQRPRGGKKRSTAGNVVKKAKNRETRRKGDQHESIGGDTDPDPRRDVAVATPDPFTTLKLFPLSSREWKTSKTAYENKVRGGGGGVNINMKLSKKLNCKIKKKKKEKKGKKEKRRKRKKRTQNTYSCTCTNVINTRE